LTYLLAFGISLALLFIVFVAVVLKQRISRLRLKSLIESQKDSSYDGHVRLIEPSQFIFAEREAFREGFFGSTRKALWKAAPGVDVVAAVKQRNYAQCQQWDMILFETVVRECAMLRHINCIRVLAYCTQAQNPLILMEWVQNGSLADALETGVPVPPHTRLRMARELAGGLAFLHASGVIHGSIKNRNILIAQDGTPKLGDRIFTLMQRYSNTMPSATDSGHVTLDLDAQLFETLALESLAFVSPELLARRHNGKYGSMVTGSCCTDAGLGSISMPEDVYALGVVMWTLLTWKSPFDGMTPSHVKSYISEGMHVPLPIPQQLPSGFSSDYVDLMTQCLNTDPSLRPTAELLSKLLKAIDPSTRPVEPIQIVPLGFVSDKSTLLDCMLAAMPLERDKLERMIQQIINFHSTSSDAIRIIRECDLTPLEAQSISMYTFSVNNGFTWQTSPFFIYNKALRILDFEAIAAWQDYSYFLMSGLKKLPSIRRKVWRGLNLRLTQISHLYEKGSKVQLFAPFCSFLTCSHFMANIRSVGTL
jgi:serine/threonine protein kinase